MKKLLFSSAIYLLTCTPLALSAAERELVDYNTLLKITRLDDIYAIPEAERNRLVFFGTLEPKNKKYKPADVVLSLKKGTETLSIPVAADGSFALAPQAILRQANPMVMINLPAGEKSAFSFAVRPLQPEGLQWNYAALMASVQQMNKVMKSAGGVMSWFAPKFTGIEIHFQHAGQQVQVESPAGSKKYSANAEGIATLPLEEALLASDSKITLSERPKLLDFSTK